MAKPVARRYSRNTSESEVRVSMTNIVEEPAESDAEQEQDEEAVRTVKENNFMAAVAPANVSCATDVESPATIAESPAKVMDAGAEGGAAGGSGDAGDTGAALSFLRQRISENAGSSSGGGAVLPDLTRGSSSSSEESIDVIRSSSGLSKEIRSYSANETSGSSSFTSSMSGTGGVVAKRPPAGNQYFRRVGVNKSGSGRLLRRSQEQVQEKAKPQRKNKFEFNTFQPLTQYN